MADQRIGRLVHCKDINAKLARIKEQRKQLKTDQKQAKATYEAAESLYDQATQDDTTTEHGSAKRKKTLVMFLKHINLN